MVYGEDPTIQKWAGKTSNHLAGPVVEHTRYDSETRPRTTTGLRALPYAPVSMWNMAQSRIRRGRRTGVPLIEVGGDDARLRMGVTDAQHISGGFEPIPGVHGAFPYVARRRLMVVERSARFCCKQTCPLMPRPTVVVGAERSLVPPQLWWGSEGEGHPCGHFGQALLRKPALHPWRWAWGD